MRMIKATTLLIMAFSVLSSDNAFGRADPLQLNPNPMSFSGSADGTHVGTPITSNWTGENSVRYGFECARAGLGKCYVKRVRALALGDKVNGVYYSDGKHQYSVYRIPGVPGLGYAFGLKDNNDSVEYNPVDGQGDPSAGTIVYPQEGSTVNKHVNRISLKAKIIFVVTGEHLVSGSYHIPPLVIAKTWSEYGGRHQGNEQSVVTLNATEINIKARACTVNTKSLTYNMGDILIRDLDKIGSTSKLVSKQISLQCDRNIQLFAGMTDQTDQTNTSSILNLTKDSTGSGVGIQFFFNSDQTPVNFGPDISSKGQPNQRELYVTSMDNESYTLDLKSNYIRTGNLKPGSANGIASITFSYQ
ncbi:type 1 fimbrial protein [Enterobacter asburiae]|nr:type 1 fimbrial protein [Enterobacter asburiae]